MPRRLTTWLSVIFVLATQLSNATAQPSHTVRVWIDNNKDVNTNGKTTSDMTWIDLTEHPVSVEEIARISTTKDVAGLSIGSFPDAVEIDGKALAEIGNITTIRGLDFFITGVKEKDWAFLSRLKKLEHLHIDGEHLELGDNFLEVASKLHSLKTLRVIPESGFSDAAIAKLASLRNLTELDLSSSLMTDQSLKVMAGFKKLKSLRLQSPNVSKKEAEKLLDSTAIKHLRVIN